jgi:predicted lipid-binding transport protein (Tim44 family)
MDGKIDIFTLALLVLAVIVILKLRSVLGRRTSDDDSRVERAKAQERARAAAAQTNDKVVALPRRDRPEQAGAAPAPTTAEAEQKVRTFAPGDAALTANLVAIHKLDQNFDPQQFLQGARQAYEMIVTAFAEGNRKTLKDLLNRDVFDGFAAAISEREARGDQIDQSFVGINKADIVEAEVKGGTAHISVKFVSDLISATRDRAGTVLSGDPKKIKEVIDIWTFARDMTSRDPNWKLIATQASN